MARVLCIGDCHCPAMIPTYPAFLTKTYDKYRCDRVVHIGDLVDCYALSMHQKRIETIDVELEFSEAQKQVAELVDRFPRATWLIGNHDALGQRQAEAAGVPLSLLKSPGKVWNTKRWKIVERWKDHVIDGVIYRHGDKGKGGQTPALANALNEFANVVQGHFHQCGGVWVKSNSQRTTWGAQTGCGVDSDSPYMSYSKIYCNKPVLGAVVVVDKGRQAIFEPFHP